MQTDGHFFANKILFYLLDGHQDVFVLAQNGLFSKAPFTFSSFTFHLSLFISFISTILTNTGNIP